MASRPLKNRSPGELWMIHLNPQFLTLSRTVVHGAGISTAPFLLVLNDWAEKPKVMHANAAPKGSAFSVMGIVDGVHGRQE